MAKFVRACELSNHEYTLYWSCSHHMWGSLECASVFNSKQIKAFDDKNGSIPGKRGYLLYVPGKDNYKTSRWEKLP